MEKSKKSKPTAEDLRAAQRLKNLWLAIPRNKRPTQEALALRYGEGANQSLISQYFNGHIPLNLRAVFFFARELGCGPEEIYPELEGIDVVSAISGNAMAVSREPLSHDQSARRRDLLVHEEAHRSADDKWFSFSAEQKQQILKLVELAGVIGLTATPKPTSVAVDASKQSDDAVELRRDRKLRRGDRAKKKQTG